MWVEKLHGDEVDIDEAVVRRLLRTQMPHLADNDIRPVDPAGTDNVTARLGDDLVIRLPRNRAAAQRVQKEQDLLGLIALSLPCAIPVPIGRGRPGVSFPFTWSVARWIPGTNPECGEVADQLTHELARFVIALHRIGTTGYRPADTLSNYRADSVQLRDESTRSSISRCAASPDPGLIDGPLVEQVWAVARQVPDFTGGHVWVHADLHPGNLLTAGGQLVAVIYVGTNQQIVRWAHHAIGQVVDDVQRNG
jgi:aminoglycoside phosphotransferase (APT) family kinase protein